MNASILTKYKEYKDIQNIYDEKRKTFKNIEEKAEKYKGKLDEYQSLRNDCDLKVHRLDLLDKKLKSTAANKTQDKIENFELQIKDLDEHIQNLTREKSEYEAELVSLKNDKASTTRGQKSTKDILTEQNEKFKRELEKVQVDLKKARTEKTNLEVEKENNEDELVRKEKSLTNETNTIEKYKKNFEKATKELERLRNAFYKADVSIIVSIKV